MKYSSKTLKTEETDDKFSFRHLLKTSKVPKGFWNSYLKDKQELFLTQINEQMQMVNTQKRVFISTERKKRESKVGTILDNTSKSIQNMKIQAKRLKQSQEFLTSNFTALAQLSQQDEKKSQYSSTFRLSTAINKFHFKDFESALESNRKQIDNFKKPIENQKSSMQNNILKQVGVLHNINKDITKREQRIILIQSEIEQLNQKIIESKIKQHQNPIITKLQQDIITSNESLEYSLYNQQILKSMMLERSNDVTKLFVPYTLDQKLYNTATVILSKEAEKLSQHSYELDSLKRKLDENQNTIQYYKKLNDNQQISTETYIKNVQHSKFTQNVLKKYEFQCLQRNQEELQSTVSALNQQIKEKEQDKIELIQQLELKKQANLSVDIPEKSVEILLKVKGEIEQLNQRLKLLLQQREMIQFEIIALEDEYQRRNLNIQRNQTEFINPDLNPVQKQLKKSLFTRQNTINLDSSLFVALEVIYNKLAKIMHMDNHPFNDKNLVYLVKILTR